jgi:hypothetical protein
VARARQEDVGEDVDVEFLMDGSTRARFRGKVLAMVAGGGAEGPGDRYQVRFYEDGEVLAVDPVVNRVFRVQARVRQARRAAKDAGEPASAPDAGAVRGGRAGGGASRQAQQRRGLLPAVFAAMRPPDAAAATADQHGVDSGGPQPFGGSQHRQQVDSGLAFLQELLSTPAVTDHMLLVGRQLTRRGDLARLAFTCRALRGATGRGW